MPNWVINMVHFEGPKEDIDSIQELVKSEDNPFTFDNVIPVPESMYPEKGQFGVVSSGRAETQMLTYLTDCGKKDLDSLPEDVLKKYYLDYGLFKNSIDDAKKDLENIRQFSDDEMEKAYQIGKAKAENLDKYGVCDWYTFCTTYWGTKWDSCDSLVERVSDTHLRAYFTTAWSIPGGIYAKLQEMFPKVEINLVFADEDWGNNCGYIKGKGDDVWGWPDENVDPETLIDFSRYVWDGEDAFYEDEGLELEAVDREKFFELIPKECKAYVEW